MPTAGIVNSSKVKIWTGSSTPVAVACLTDASFSISAEMRDTSCKDTDQFGAVLPGKISATLSGSGLWAFDAASGANANVLHAAILASTQISWVFGTGVTGDPKYSGVGYLTSLELGSPGSFDNCTYSFEIQVSGAWTQTTY